MTYNLKQLARYSCTMYDL